MKVTVNSVATVTSAVAMDPGVLARGACLIVGKTVEPTVEPTMKVSDFNAAALAAFAFDPSVTITKVVCENPGPINEELTLAAAGILDNSKVNCRFTIKV